MSFDDHIDVGVETDKMTLPWLHGFWDEGHNTLSLPIPRALQRGVGLRAKAYLDTMARGRYRCDVHEWARWRFEAERRFL